MTVVYYVPADSSSGIVEITNDEGVEQLAKWKGRRIKEVYFDEPNATDIPEFILLVDSAWFVQIIVDRLDEKRLTELLKKNFHDLSITVRHLDRVYCDEACNVQSFSIECPTTRRIELARAIKLTSVSIYGAHALEFCQLCNPTTLDLDSVGGPEGVKVDIGYGNSWVRWFDELAIHALNGDVYWGSRFLEVAELHVDMKALHTLMATRQEGNVEVSRLYVNVPIDAVVGTVSEEIKRIVPRFNPLFTQLYLVPTQP